MSATAPTLSGALPPSVLRLRRFTAATARAAALVVAAYALFLVRGDTSIVFHVAATGVVLGCVYVALGSGFKSWGLYIVGFIVFAQLRSHADAVGTAVQYEYPIVAEKAMFLGYLPNNVLQEAFYVTGRLRALEVATIAVYISYFFVPHMVALAIWKWDRQRFKPYALAFMLTLYIGLVVSALAPTAPPWLAGETAGIERVHHVLPEIARNVAPGAYERGYEASGPNPVAAMPSLHSAVPFLIMLAAWRYRRARVPAVAYAAAMPFALVYLGEHYFVDALAGFAVAWASWVVVRKVLSTRAGERRTEADLGAETPFVSVPKEASHVNSRVWLGKHTVTPK